MNDDDYYDYPIYFMYEDCTCEHTAMEHCSNSITATAGCEVDDCECKAMWIDDY